MEIDDLKKITNSLTVLCSEKQKQEKVRASCTEKMPYVRVGLWAEFPQHRKELVEILN